MLGLEIRDILILAPGIVFALTFHEYAHAYAAFRLGDSTAKGLGRLSLNPVVHLDLIGTVMLFIAGFGWAKPVPVDPRNFQSPRRDMMYVAIAGPLSNIALAVACSFFIRLISPEFSYLFVILAYGIWINVALAIFNMLPMYPLDGSSVLKGMVSPKIAERMTNLDRFGAFLILGVFLLDHFAQTGILATILMLPINYSVLFLSQETFPMIIEVLRASFA